MKLMLPVGAGQASIGAPIRITGIPLLRKVLMAVWASVWYFCNTRPYPWVTRHAWVCCSRELDHCYRGVHSGGIVAIVPKSSQMAEPSRTRNTVVAPDALAMYEKSSAA